MSHFQHVQKGLSAILCWVLVTINAVCGTVGEEGFSNAGYSLTWEDCLRIALTNHPGLVAAHQQVRAAQAAVAAARSDLRPQFSLTAGAEHTEQDGKSVSDDASLNATLQAEQVLYTGGRKTAALDSAQAAAASAQAVYREKRASVSHQLRTAFVKLLIAQERLGVLEQIERRRRENYELVKLRYEGGREHKGSLAMIEAGYFQAQVEHGQAAREVETARRILAEALGWSIPPSSFSVTGPLQASAPPDPSDISALVEQTPDVNSALASVRAAQAALRSAESGGRPSLSLVGSAGRSGDTDSFETDRWSVGLRLSFPFWQGGRTRHEIAQAEARRVASQAQLEELRHRLAAELYETLQSYRNALEDEQVQARYFQAADLRAEIARQQYGAGLLTFENWDVIENDRIAYQRRLLEAQRTALLAEAAWNLAVRFDAFSAINEDTP